MAPHPVPDGIIPSAKTAWGRKLGKTAVTESMGQLVGRSLKVLGAQPPKVHPTAMR